MTASFKSINNISQMTMNVNHRTLSIKYKQKTNLGMEYTVWDVTNSREWLLLGKRTARTIRDLKLQLERELH